MIFQDLNAFGGGDFNILSQDKLEYVQRYAGHTRL
jgi:hypothetical protein